MKGKNKMKQSGYVPFRDISVHLLGTELTFSFSNIYKDLIHLKLFEEMVHTRFKFGDRQMVHL
ncbi:hypothetical protein MKW98_014445, partial [Papaver atlanticum]